MESATPSHITSANSRSRPSARASPAMETAAADRRYRRCRPFEILQLPSIPAVGEHKSVTP
jgi:hypothetical protein